MLKCFIWVFLWSMRNVFLGFEGWLCIWMYVNCKWPIMKLLLEWGIDGMFVALGHCYCWMPLLKKHGIHRISPSYYCQNYEVVPPYNNVKSQNQKGQARKTKKKAKQRHCSPHTWKNLLVWKALIDVQLQILLMYWAPWVRKKGKRK